MKVKDEKQIEARKQQIIKIAENIVVEEGIEKLSIRKIAAKMNQTPGILYHYFKDKDEIILALVAQGYQDILSLMAPSKACINASDRLRNILHNYIRAMTLKDKLFLILMQSTNDEIKEKVNILTVGIEDTRKSMNALCKGLREGVKEGVFACDLDRIEIRAQVIWCATYGLISRLIVENPDETLKENLINEHLNMIIQSLAVKNANLIEEITQ